MASVVGFRCKDKPALTPVGVGKYLPPPPTPPLPSAPPEQYMGREDESVAKVEGDLLAPMRIEGKERELESPAWVLDLHPTFTSDPL